MLRAAAGPEGDFELFAARVAHRLLGADVVVQDDGSRDAMPDLRIERPGAPAAYGEVVLDMDTRYGSLQAGLLMLGGGSLPFEHPDARLGRVWLARVDGRYRLKARAADINALAALEADGRTLATYGEFSTLVESGEDPGVTSLYARGFVDLCSRTPRAGEVAGLRIGAEGVTGRAHPDWVACVGWLDSVLASGRLADVRRKLAASGLGERHLFLGLTFTSDGDAFHAFTSHGKGLPAVAPVLPGEVTHLWLLSVHGGRGLAWDRGSGWSDVSRHWRLP